MIGRITAVLVALAMVLSACATTADEDVDLAGGDSQAGADSYAQRCAACHGADAEGNPEGPPLVHELYRTDRYEDIEFLRAVRNGARTQHWDFGPMPVIRGVSDEEIGDIIAFVRGLQAAAGF